MPRSPEEQTAWEVEAFGLPKATTIDHLDELVKLTRDDPNMTLMSILSDTQEMLIAGHLDMARQALNVVKLAIGDAAPLKLWQRPRKFTVILERPIWQITDATIDADRITRRHVEAPSVKEAIAAALADIVRTETTNLKDAYNDFRPLAVFAGDAQDVYDPHDENHRPTLPTE